MLVDLAGWEQRPSCLTTMAYELCSTVLENYSNLTDGRQLLFLSLQIGFRHLDPNIPKVQAELTHTGYHHRMAGVVFGSAGSEIIADLLHAWTSHSDSHQPSPSLGMCARRLVGLRSSSRRLRRLVIRAVGSIGYQRFKRVASKGFFELLDHLHPGVEEIDDKGAWAALLLDIIQSPKGVRHLSSPYWELLLELSLSGPVRPGRIAWNPDIVTYLERAQEGGKLECWMGIIWRLWPPETTDVTTEGDIGRVSLSLFRQRPGSVWKLGQRLVERWSEERPEGVPESFRRICDEACLEWRSRLNRKFPFLVASTSYAYGSLCFVLDMLRLSTRKWKSLRLHHHRRRHRHLGRTLSRRSYLYKS